MRRFSWNSVSACALAAILALVSLQAHAILMLGGSASGAVVGGTWFGATLPTAPTPFSTTSSPPSAASTCNGSYFTPSTGATLQTDINTAAANSCANGDVIELTAGTTYTTTTSFNLPSHSGGWIYLISSDAPEISGTGLPAAGTRVSATNVADMASLRSSCTTCNGYLLERSSGATLYRLVGLDMELADANQGSGANEYVVNFNNGDTSLSTLAQHITIDRCYIDGSQSYGVTHAIDLDGEYMEVTESYFGNHIFTIGDADNQAIAIFNSVGPYKIHNNYLQASGEITFTGGSDTSLPSPSMPSDITINDNDYYKPVVAATGSVAGTTTLTITAVSSGYLQITAIVTGTDIPTNDQISKQLTGTGGATCPDVTCTGLVGTYQLASAASGTASGAIASYSSGKNMMEFKVGQRVLFDSNYLANAGAEGQARSAFTLTALNQEGGNPWYGFTDLTISNNVFTNAMFGLINFKLQDNVGGAGNFDTAAAVRVLFRNNIFIATTNDGSDSTAGMLLASNSPSNDQIVNFVASVAGASSGTLTASVTNTSYAGQLGYSGTGQYPGYLTYYRDPIVVTGGTAANWSTGGGNLPASPAITYADISTGGGGGGSSIIFDHNTFINTFSTGFPEAIVFGGGPAAMTLTNCVFSNNIFDISQYGIATIGAGGSFSFGYSSSIPTNCTSPAFVNNVLTGSSDSTLPSGNFKPAAETNVGYTSYGSDTSASGYALTGGSTYHAAGVTGAGLPYNSGGTGDSTDIGVNVSALPTS